MDNVSRAEAESLITPAVEALAAYVRLIGAADRWSQQEGRRLAVADLKKNS